MQLASLLLCDSERSDSRSFYFYNILYETLVYLSDKISNMKTRVFQIVKCYFSVYLKPWLYRNIYAKI